MRQVCYRCRREYGVKPPLDNDTETSGLCQVCYPIELDRLEKWLEEERAKAEKEMDR